MKKYCVLMILPLLAWGFATQAQELVQGTRRGSIGLNGSVSAGGDVKQSQLGFGFQGEFGITDNFSVELATSTFSDDITVEGLKYRQDLTTIGLSGLFRLPITEIFNVHLLGGIDYNLINANMDGAVMIGNRGYAFKTNVNDTFGGHLGAGVGFRLANNIELFTEYRFTMMNPTGNIAAEVDGTSYRRSIDGSYNFGLFKLGLNYLFY
jgi:opacity protein-like surface antigen